MDMENVSYGLRCMCYGDVECKECPYAKDGSGWYNCRSNCAKDALELLKEKQDISEEFNNAIELVHKKNEIIKKLLKSEPQIVRCKDCTWFIKMFENKGRCIKHDNDFHELDWFCADGERNSND